MKYKTTIIADDDIIDELMCYPTSRLIFVEVPEEIELCSKKDNESIDEVIKATDTIKNFCAHQDKCEGCIFNRHVAGSTDHCAILWDTPSEWNFKKEDC